MILSILGKINSSDLCNFTCIFKTMPLKSRQNIFFLLFKKPFPLFSAIFQLFFSSKVPYNNVKHKNEGGHCS